MKDLLSRRWLWLLAALLLAMGGDALLLQRALNESHERFETDARIMHRLLSQRAAQHDAVLASLNLFHTQPASDAREQRLSSLYPQLLAVAQRTPGAGSWQGITEAAAARALDDAVERSRKQGVATTAGFDPARGRFWLVGAGLPASHALLIDLHRMVPWADWPGGAEGSSGRRIRLELAGAQWPLASAAPLDSRWRFSFRKPLAGSQPFDIVVEQAVGWADVPWFALFAWTVLAVLLVAAIASSMRQQRARQRTELLRQMERVSRLNAMGELAAGMAHELNQPLTAVLASTQAAARLLAEQPPDIDAAAPAMQRAAEQARRAADVLARLRQMVAQPDTALNLAAVDLVPLARRALFVLEPECRSLAITPLITGAPSVWARADRLAVEQILHNLLANALTALAAVPSAQRRLSLELSGDGTHSLIAVRDSGCGFSAAVLPHVFEPFFTTRHASDGNAATSNGLGLGLSLCESLVQRMGGHIEAANAEGGGALLRILLPHAAAPESAP